MAAKANDPTRAVCAAGCDVVAGSGVFGASDRALRLREMKAVAAEAQKKRFPVAPWANDVRHKKGYAGNAKPSAYIWTTRQPRHCAMRPQKAMAPYMESGTRAPFGNANSLHPLVARRSRSKMRVLAWLAP